MRTSFYILTAAAFCTAALFLATARGGPGSGAGLPVSDEPNAEAPLGIRGQVRGLTPGASKRLRLRFANRHRFAVRVRAINVRIAGGAPGCPAKSLKIGAASPSTKRLPPTSRRTARAKVRMRPSAPDGCRGVKFPLDFQVRANRTGSGG